MDTVEPPTLMNDPAINESSFWTTHLCGVLAWKKMKPWPLKLKSGAGTILKRSIWERPDTYPELWADFIENIMEFYKKIMDPRHPNRRLAQFLRGENINFIDTLDLLEKEGQKNANLYFPINLHLTREGMKLVSDLIYQ